MKIAGMAALVAALVVTACGGKGPEALGEAFFSALDAGETDKALKMFGPDAGSSPMGGMLQLKLKEYADEIDEHGGLKSVKCSAPTEKMAAVKKAGRGLLKLSCKLDFGNGSSDTDAVDLRLRDGEWRIDVQ